jgi:hypothetical protein
MRNFMSVVHKELQELAEVAGEPRQQVDTELRGQGEHKEIPGEQQLVEVEVLLRRGEPEEHQQVYMEFLGLVGMEVVALRMEAFRLQHPQRQYLELQNLRLHSFVHLG